LPLSVPERNDEAAGLAVAVREAGSLARAAFGTGIRTWFKNQTSPVSEIDIAVNDLLRGRLAAIAPDAAWLSEETEDDPARLGAARVWIVDPIDGTRAFIAGEPDWTISVALVAGGRPVLAALHAPVFDEFFFAAAGGGATCNQVSIAARAGDGLASVRIAGPKNCLQRLAAVAPSPVMVPRVHSLALRLARVADGTLDIAVAGADSNDWDLAAADLLVHEAGGALTTTGGATPIYNRAATRHGVLLAAGRARHRALIERLQQHDLTLR
jgi:myo-inositol-1(or 4)-monophosphatase